ncbi:peptidase MA superfamily [Gottschalkia purinilytica]|uniref:Peptidase MA superfamily n=1 Tax=Gottschalkia purinilytica TaxID=1503 RepID=A0A0L0WA21_GOTPU|nr:hypothetical protein [Gottschalkia purinilytica]KNF08160.1 peptidase MA superfamily [Gottschalkia purinilytica]
MRKNIEIIMVGGIIFLCLLAISFLPRFQLKTKNMLATQTENFIIYYDRKDKKVAKDIALALEQVNEHISLNIEFNKKNKTEVYIYPSLKTFHSKRYGYIGSLLAPETYNGDNMKDKIMVVSPRGLKKPNSHDSVIKTSIHEYVHVAVYHINKRAPRFLEEGLAGYLSENTEPMYKLEDKASIDSTKMQNLLKPGNRTPYEASYTYIEFLDKEFGMKNVLKLLKQPSSYKNIFGLSREEVYKDWGKYLKENY